MGPYDPWGMFCKHPVGGHELRSRISDRNYALCTRPLEADLLHIAKDAQVNHPVPDVQTLKNIVPLNKARLAFQAGQYQESVARRRARLRSRLILRQHIGAWASPTECSASGSRPSPISNPRLRSTSPEMRRTVGTGQETPKKLQRTERARKINHPCGSETGRATFPY